MTYTLQKDVALVTVCDEHFLVAAGQARGKVPAVKGINRPGAYFWNLLQQKLPENDILRHTAADYHIPTSRRPHWHCAASPRCWPPRAI